MLWAWHAPAVYGLALTNPIVHEIEHLCFMGGYLLYWWPLVAPSTVVGRLHSNVARAGYLLAGATQSALLGAVILFRSSVIYSQYLHLPGATLSSALVDQRVAGAIMWFPGAIVFALAAALAMREGDTERQEDGADAVQKSVPQSVIHGTPVASLARVPNTIH
jgi:cytochrome c oxidase assembly factor CtaG